MGVEFGLTVECWLAIGHRALEFSVHISICVGLFMRPNIITVGETSAANWAWVWLFQSLKNQIDYEWVQKCIGNVHCLNLHVSSDDAWGSSSPQTPLDNAGIVWSSCLSDISCVYSTKCCVRTVYRTCYTDSFVGWTEIDG